MVAFLIMTTMTITRQKARQMTTESLVWTRRDLGEVIAIQERTVREFPGSCSKLGTYHDELFEVLAELKRRGPSTGGAL